MHGTRQMTPENRPAKAGTIQPVRSWPERLGATRPESSPTVLAARFRAYSPATGPTSASAPSIPGSLCGPSGRSIGCRIWSGSYP